MTTFTFKTNDKDAEMLQNYLDEHNLTLVEYIIEMTKELERIEDEEDAKIAEEAYAEYLADPVTYTTDELLQNLGLTREDIA